MELFAHRDITAAQLFADAAPYYDGTTGRNEAGVRVSSETAITDDAVYAAISLLAGDIASLPMRALVTSDAGLSQPLSRQPAWIEAPDPLDIAITDVVHKTQVVLSLLLAGNAYVMCEPSVHDPVRLTILNPTYIRVQKPGTERLFEVMGRSSVYGSWTNYEDPLDTLTAARVLHIPYMLLPGALEGIGPVQAQTGNIAISLAMRKWVETFFGKGAQVAGFVSLPPDAKALDAEDTQKRITSRWSSWRRAGIIGVLGGGAQWVKTGLSPQDANLDGLWRRQLEMVARSFGIPPFMIGSQEPAGVAYASSVERAQHYIDHCLNRYTRPIEKAYSRLVPGDGRLSVPGSNTEIRFNFDAFLRGDPKARWETHRVALQAKATTIGEVRAYENRPPMGDYTPEYLAGPDGLLATPNNSPAGGDTPKPNPMMTPPGGPPA